MRYAFFCIQYKEDTMIIQTPFATVKNNELYIDGVRATALAEKYGTPLYVMSEGHIRHQMNELKTEFMDKFDNVLPLFASKAFSCLEIYRLASEYGIGIDCVSAGEISMALKAGFDPQKIYFHGNNKLPSEIKYAVEHNVTHFVVDNFYEIELIEKLASKPVYATVRVTPGIEAGGHRYIMTAATDTKFGFSTHDGSHFKAIELILHSKNIVFEGIHAHIGSQVFELEKYEEAMEKFVEISYEIYDRFGVVISKLNAGGGYGIAYTHDDCPMDFVSITERIMKVITEGFEKRGWKRPMVLIEPGRYVVGNAGITLYTVGAIKDIPGIRKYVSVDGGMSDNIRTALYGARYEGLLANRAEEEPEETVRVTGKICESGDVLIDEIKLPKVNYGDILAVFSTGAYHYTMSSNYNQLPKPAIVFTYKGKARQVVRRQSFDDLVYCDVREDYEEV